MSNAIEYSDKYSDGDYEYRHVFIPKEQAKRVPKDRTLTEAEWRHTYKVTMSRGWEHYGIHRPEPHVLLFRRPLGTDPTTGEVDPELREVEIQRYLADMEERMEAE
ncbi:cyclin-dependent kinase regulatory subunit-domain-containing protein [Tribonema minus]|uniref:Cyclin-dependent kinases regulatory subunit n=1 Tax=Tribonema minus TaxID=303371 RepID=A0A835YZC6_9STRA|nr:cyclin-dependent kinase regulatory subunit-domain-containing protein [Tribonema minus]